jgi:RPA family protein
MNAQEILQENQYKRNIAYKLRIGQILAGEQNIQDEKLLNIKVANKEVSRVNIIANIIDKFIQEGEKQFGSITLDDASGQIKVKVFGQDLDKIQDLQQGDTIVLIGLLRTWNQEIYIIPEIIKKKSPEFLLIRKLETDLEIPKSLSPDKTKELKEKILLAIKQAETSDSEETNPESLGIEVDKLILNLKESPEVINSEIKKLLEEGLIYEPRPGKLRYLG